jgi:hypothetical protein
LLPTKITIFVGDVGMTTANAALAVDKEAVLLDNSNYLQFLNNELLNNTFYTSLGDLPNNPDAMYYILAKADDIVYCPVNHWSDGKTLRVTDVSSSMQGLTEFILFNIANIKYNVSNLDLTKYNPTQFVELADSRKDNNPQLWVAGGSDTFGFGVNTNDRYGDILGNKLSLSVSTLAAAGGSISWIADQIIRSDIRPGDFVVVGLVPDSRLPVWSSIKNKIIHLAPVNNIHDKFVDIPKSAVNQFLVSDTMLYENVIHVHQIVNYCKKAGARLLIMGISCSDSLIMHLNDIIEFKNYVNFDVKNSIADLVDTALDGKHPGPLQHQLYADFCYQQFKKLDYI